MEPPIGTRNAQGPHRYRHLPLKRLDFALHSALNQSKRQVRHEHVPCLADVSSMPDFDKIIADGLDEVLAMPLRLPDWAQSWDNFLAKLGSAMGKIVVYQQDDNKKWKLCGANVQPSPGRIKLTCDSETGQPRYSVRDWAVWYLEFQRNPEWQTEAYYLSDVMPSGNQLYWRSFVELNPLLARMWDRTSELSLHSYLEEYCPSISIPPMDPPFYIAPVLPGSGVIAETPPHLDGHGSQTAYHLCLFGDGYNEVLVWEALLEQKGKSKELCQQEWSTLLTKLGICEVPTLPHDVDGYLFWSGHWEEKLTADSFLKLNLKKKIALTPGNLILLPAGLPHMFSKVRSFTLIFTH